jgi:hypothetical protein
MQLGLWTTRPTEEELTCAEYHEQLEAQETAIIEAETQSE